MEYKAGRVVKNVGREDVGRGEASGIEEVETKKSTVRLRQ